MDRFSRIIQTIKVYLKGSKRDPFLYLGISTVILFALLCFLSPSSQVSSPVFVQTIQGKGGDTFLISGLNIKESPDLSLIQKNSLAAVSPPITVTPQVLGALAEGSTFEEARRAIIEYTIREGDSLWSIAVKFDISVDTIVWANDVDSALIRPGQKLLILPVSGVMHLVEKGDTVGSIAKKYKTEADKIIAFNDLADDSDIFEGELLIIPDGQVPYYSSIQPVDSGRLSTNNFYGMSHNYPYGQCTWWVAQKRAIPRWGNAKDWLQNAAATGYATCRGRYCVPQVGAVISLVGDPIYGHVAYVEQVKGDKVIFSEMNYIGWGRINYRTLRVGSPLIRGYIY
jgi:surface antigen